MACSRVKFNFTQQKPKLFAEGYTPNHKSGCILSDIFLAITYRKIQPINICTCEYILYSSLFIHQILRYDTMLQIIRIANWIKYKISPVHYTKEHGGSRGIAQLIFNFDATQKLSASLPSRAALLANKRLGEPQSRSGWIGQGNNQFFLPELKLLNVQPAAYWMWWLRHAGSDKWTDWVIVTHNANASEISNNKVAILRYGNYYTAGIITLEDLNVCTTDVK